MSVVHSFRADLALSNQHADDPFWQEVYRTAFPTMIATHVIKQDGWAQRGGIDRVVLLASSRTVHIEQKVRRDVWPDIALEYWSNYEMRQLGWMEKDAATDYLAYAFLPTRQCYLFDFLSLRRTWKAHRTEWLERARRDEGGFKTIPSENEQRNGAKYTTWCVAIPIDKLLAALNTHMCIEWSVQ